MQGYLTPPEAARQLEISERTIRRWLKKRLIPARRHPSGHWWIPESWVQEKLQEEATHSFVSTSSEPSS